MKFENLSVARKPCFGAAAVLLTMTGAAIVGQRISARALGDAIDEVQSHEGRTTLAVKWKGMTETSTQRVIAIALSNEDAISQAFSGPMKEGIAAIGVLQKQISDASTLPQEKQALEAVAQRRVVVLDLLKTIDGIKKTGARQAVADAVNQQLLPAVAVYMAALDGFIRIEEGLSDSAEAAARAESSRAALWSAATMGLVFVLGMLAVAALARSISGPLGLAVDAARKIAQGDLTARLATTRSDEIGRLMSAMDQMSERLRGLVGDVRLGVDSVSTASHQIATGNQDLSQRTEQTAANLQQTASSMEELTGTVGQSADTARQATVLAASAAQAATRGGEVVEEVVKNMGKIADSSRRISEIIGVIDGIAFQTNILALNAAVEAARAGDQGRGFAVVASEVRGLAQRSAAAAREIKALIVSSVETVDSGAALVAQTGSSMQDIVASVRKVSDLIAEIASSATEQHDGISQVDQAIANLDQMTQQNAALVEESAAAAQSLRDQARRLAEVVSVFRLSAPIVANG